MRIEGIREALPIQQSKDFREICTAFNASCSLYESIAGVTIFAVVVGIDPDTPIEQIEPRLQRGGAQLLVRAPANTTCEEQAKLFREIADYMEAAGSV